METRTFTDTDGIFIFLIFGSLLLRMLINDVIVNDMNKTRFWIFAMWGFDQSVWDCKLPQDQVRGIVETHNTPELWDNEKEQMDGSADRSDAARA